MAATFCAALVDEWVRAGVRHAVIAPGSRSTPLALALAARDELALHVFHDERSAAFAALGIGCRTGVPAVLLCTSGTAAAHFHAAVLEADLSGVPMLVCTADRPAELHDVGAAQTLDQHHLYGHSVRWFHAPGVADPAASGAWRSLAARAVLATRGPNPGPVHLNLAFREPLVGVARDLPPGRPDGAPWTEDADGPATIDVGAVAPLLDVQRGVIVAGVGSPRPQAVQALAEATGWPVLADAVSGVSHVPGAVRRFDSLLRVERFAADHAPQAVLRFGQPPASKVLAQWIAASGAIEVQAAGRPVVLDPAHAVRLRVTGDLDALCTDLASRVRGASGTPWAARWRHAEDTARRTLQPLLRGQLSEPAVADAVLAGIAGPANVVAASSMPVRAVEWFGSAPAGVRVHANRGANGIDGVLSTAIGVALGSGEPTVALLGDIAFVHDSSALAALSGRGADVRIVVVDNDGGGIFSFLPQAKLLAPERFEQLFGTPHGTDVGLLAEAHGLPASDASTVADVEAFVAKPGPALLRVRLDRSANTAAYQALNEAVAKALTR